MLNSFVNRLKACTRVREVKTKMGKCLEIFKILNEVPNFKISQRKFSRFMGISDRSLNRWVIRDKSNKPMKPKGRPRKMKEKDEKELVDWIKNQLSQNLAPSKKEIVLQANELIRHKQLPDLNHYNIHEQIISTNWVKAFSERNKLIITESQNIQKEKPLPTNEDLVDYFVNLKRLKEKNNYQRDKRKTVERNFVDNFSTVPLSFVFSESGYMNQNLFHLFITSILLPNIRQRRKKIGKNAKALLILDNAPSHYNSESIKICKKNLIQILFLPSNSTDFLQPLDVGCFKGFKSYIKRQLIDGTYESFLSTIQDGLQVSLTLKNIRNSFKTCGITPYETLVELPNNTPIAKPKKQKKRARLSLGGQIVTSKNFLQVLENNRKERLRKRKEKESLKEAQLLFKFITFTNQTNQKKEKDKQNNIKHFHFLK
ncbi:hypothetical protein M0812_02438 [Anaeramoeba flamelloides]|uniref:HTH CENPB-type domain-containing protein n=1 Tax=Anaeramoeba flamelloides TaxID=1746091 RepID=A0AAV7YQ40_9EUKA|nr:hypothetical protein M0812_02438 [Anaeramoeba flamelloides]